MPGKVYTFRLHPEDEPAFRAVRQAHQDMTPEEVTAIIAVTSFQLLPAITA